MSTRSRCWSAALLLTASLLSAEVYYERPAQAGAHVNVDINFFYGALAAYGSWVDHRLYGRVWYPSGVPMGWRPYTDGHWDYTYEYGWTWVSDWVWGWAPFHYGRWIWDDWYGWVWIPGSVWAPAWVVWRYGGGYTAWAPMPPNIVWSPGYGITTHYFDYDRDLPWDYWVCVPERRFRERNINRYVIDAQHNDRYLRTARNFVNAGMERNAVFNYGVPVKHIEKISGKRVQPLRFHEVERPQERGRDERKNAIYVYRPHFRAPGEDELRRDRSLAEQMGRQNEARHRESFEARFSERQSRLPGRLQNQGQTGADSNSRSLAAPQERAWPGRVASPDIIPDRPNASDRGRNDRRDPEQPHNDFKQKQWDTPDPGQQEFMSTRQGLNRQREREFEEERNLEAWQQQRRDRQEQIRQRGLQPAEELQKRRGQDAKEMSLPREKQWLNQWRDRQEQLQREEINSWRQRQTEQAEREREAAVWRQQQQERQEQLHRQQSRQQEQMEMQRRQVEQAEQSRQEQLQRQQQRMEMQRNREEQAERANREAMRQQQMLEQQQQESLHQRQEMQMQRQQEAYRQKMETQRQQQDAYRQQMQMQRQQEAQMQRQAQERQPEGSRQSMPQFGRRQRPGAD